MSSRPLPLPLSDALWLRLASTLTLALLVVAAAASGLFRPFERRLDELTFAALEREASGQVQVVEMDAASMAAIQRWPWPRDHYARVVQRLDAAGVRSISFDVDFSGSGVAAEDRAFGRAIAAAKAPVALPTFVQSAGFRDGRQLDSLPIRPLRDGAHLTSVSMVLDDDGFLRRMPLGTVTEGVARPSLAVFVAGRAGSTRESFPIDFAVDPASIPRHSFIAIERGAFQPDLLKGKDVIIGATAVELGDRYPVPRYGTVPGVMLQAVAAETLRDGVPAYGGWLAPLALAVLFGLVVGGARRRRGVMERAAVGTAVIGALWLGARVIDATWFEIVPALALLAATLAVRLAILTHRALTHQRRIDGESGLPNRLALDRCADATDHRYVVAAQIDDFDSLKLAVGSDNVGELLRRLAERLQVAAAAETIYRIEDRSLVWHTSLDLSQLDTLMAGLKSIMRSPFEMAGRRLGVSLTFGVASTDARGAASSAAHAAALAKRSGKPWRVHTEGEQETAAQQFSLLGDLDDALREGHITVLYQPKLNLASGRVDAAEALVRWQHPVRGLLPPACFIPLIEETSRIDDLTLDVLQQAIRDMRKWCEQGLVVGVAVNISAVLLASESFAVKALALIARAGVPTDRLTFEVTESVQFEDADRAVAILEVFHKAGIRISMDDYGTGQSTLNYLKLLPVSELKIDRSFVQQAHVEQGDAMLVRSTVQLAHELGITVVAEGVESLACLAFQQSVGCDYAQGYFVGRPVPAHELAELVRQPATMVA